MRNTALKTMKLILFIYLKTTSMKKNKLEEASCSTSSVLFELVITRWLPVEAASGWIG